MFFGGREGLFRALVGEGFSANGYSDAVLEIASPLLCGKLAQPIFGVSAASSLSFFALFRLPLVSWLSPIYAETDV